MDLSVPMDDLSELLPSCATPFCNDLRQSDPVDKYQRRYSPQAPNHLKSNSWSSTDSDFSFDNPIIVDLAPADELFRDGKILPVGIKHEFPTIYALVNGNPCRSSIAEIIQVEEHQTSGGNDHQPRNNKIDAPSLSIPLRAFLGAIGEAKRPRRRIASTKSGNGKGVRCENKYWELELGSSCPARSTRRRRRSFGFPSSFGRASLCSIIPFLPRSSSNGASNCKGSFPGRKQSAILYRDSKKNPQKVRSSRKRSPASNRKKKSNCNAKPFQKNHGYHGVCSAGALGVPLVELFCLGSFCFFKRNRR